MTAASPKPLSPEPSHRVLEQAAKWFALLSSGESTAADQRRWEAWLAESIEHQQAWTYVERISHRFEPIKNSQERQIAINVYEQASSSLLRRRKMLTGIAAFAGSGLLGWFTWQQSPLPSAAQAWMADYRTGTGEMREILLSDDTRVWINALSAFNLDYRPNQRCLHLVRGEILIDTAVDPLQRPFYVETPQGRLQALGTRFTVRLDKTDTLVSIFEGNVEVRTATTGTTAIIPAGQQTRFTDNALMASEAADPARETWRNGLLVARNIPLSVVVQELRRHYPGHLSLAPEVADLRVFGGYPVNDPDKTLAMLESVMPIRVRRILPWWISIEPRD